MKFTKKASTILVLEILKRYTDENNYITQADIIKHIQNDYNLSLERKSISQSIKVLKDVGYDILAKASGGYALVDKPFNESQITYLIDLVLASKSVSGLHAKEIIDKLKEELSKSAQQKYTYSEKSRNVTRTQNKEVFYTIDIINEAIRNDKWISFKYLSYDENGNQIYKLDNYTYNCSPCALVNNHGRYYVLCVRSKHPNEITPFRVDYIKEAVVREDRVRIPLNKIGELKSYKDISEYMNDHIYVFGGPIVRAKLEISEPNALATIYDWFGDNAKFTNKNGKLIISVKCNENALYHWIMQYANLVKKVISPTTLKEKVIKGAESILDKYKNEVK